MWHFGCVIDIMQKGMDTKISILDNVGVQNMLQNCHTMGGDKTYIVNPLLHHYVVPTPSPIDHDHVQEDKHLIL